MTTTSSTPNSSTLDPDELCAICAAKRDEHGDRNHEFNTEGLLIPKKLPEPAKQQPPRERGETVTQLSQDMTAQAFLRLVDVLVEKEILNAKDLLRILGNFNASN